MLRTLWRSIDRFSLQHFKYIINELRMIKAVDKLNRELVADLVQSIVEIVTYGHRHDPSIFECFMEYQVLEEFVRVLKVSGNSRIEGLLLQYLSIMIQNLDSDHAIYYCLSNDYINSIITHQYNFDGEDLAPCFISFLRAVGAKINRDTLCLLVKVHEDVVVSFPLYSEALKFAFHEEKMIQTAVRALTLKIFNVSDDMVHQFVTAPPVSEYFFNLVLSIRKRCFHLDSLVHASEETCIYNRRKDLLLETNKILDDLYYFKDMLCVGQSCLSKVVAQNLVSLLIFPILQPLLHLSKEQGSYLSAITSFYIVSCLLQVVGGKDMVNFVASTILFSCTTSCMRDNAERATTDAICQVNSLATHLHKMEEMLCSEPECAEKFERNYLVGHLADHMSSNSNFDSFSCDDVQRRGIISHILSEDNKLMLASLMLFLIVVESTDLDHDLAAIMGISQTKTKMQKKVDGCIFERQLPQILSALLRVLASQPPVSILEKLHAGWFLRKLLVFQGRKLNSHDICLFSTSYEQSCLCLQKELDGCWFDHVPDTLRNEWTSCRRALEESTQSKDPLFAIELACQQYAEAGTATSSLAWESMVNTVKVFVIHLQLKAFIFNGDPFENPMMNLKSSSLAISGRTYASDLSSASFGSEVALGGGVPCKITFSKVGLRDIHMIPLARGISGKLLLVERHPLHSENGVVIAICPLAGLSPKTDENHPTWLHLRIREFDPRFNVDKRRGQHSGTFGSDADGRWTLGFPNAEACEAARLLILEETDKQRSSVESLLSPLLLRSYS